MNKLVYLEPNKIDAVPFTTSDIVAEHAGVKHHAIQQLFTKYESDFADFGLVRFEMRAVKMNRGIKHQKIYLLNEEQATLLITYLKNTPKVREFKKELVRQFYVMRTELDRRHIERTQLKPVRRELTDVIQQISDGKWIYKQYTDLSYKVVTGKIAKKLREERGASPKAKAIDYMTADEIHAVAEIQYRIAVLLETGMNYQQVKEALNRLPARRLSA